jgi:hypothetical protein
MNNSTVIVVGFLLVILYLAATNKKSKFWYKQVDASNIRRWTKLQPRNPEAFKSSDIVSNLHRSSHETQAAFDTSITPISTISTGHVISQSFTNEVPADNARIDANIPQHQQDDDKYIKLAGNTMADIFTPKINHAAELGIDQDTLNHLVEDYREKYLKEKHKPTPRNIYFSKSQYDTVLNNTLKESALSINKRRIRQDSDKDMLNNVYKDLAKDNNFTRYASRAGLSAPVNRGIRKFDS